MPIQFDKIIQKMISEGKKTELSWAKLNGVWSLQSSSTKVATIVKHEKTDYKGNVPQPKVKVEIKYGDKSTWALLGNVKAAKRYAERWLHSNTYLSDNFIIQESYKFILPTPQNGKAKKIKTSTTIDGVKTGIDHNKKKRPETIPPAKSFIKTLKNELREEIATFDTFAAKRGASKFGYGDAGTHMTSRHVSGRAKNSMMKKLAKDGAELSGKRDALKKEYDAHVASGKIRPPSSSEALKVAASGHPDNQSVQAAQRVLAKRAARQAAQQQNEETTMLAERDEKMLKRWRLVRGNGTVINGYDSKEEALRAGRVFGHKHCRLMDTEKDLHNG